MSESSYDRKRSFDATPEPPGEHHTGDVDPLLASAGSTFVVQQHHATALHHDVRLEMLNGDVPVLVSWAVPKGLPRRRGDRHLAIRTEDHPMEYASFSGSIPEGEYGGGVVRIFDQGVYELVDRSEDRITFRLEGARLRGVWHLVHTRPIDGKDGWLALMSVDERPEPDPWPEADPMTASPGEEPFTDDAWWFEPRWPGVRSFAVCTDETHLFTTAEVEVTESFPGLGRLHDRVVALDAMLDGVIVAFAGGLPVPHGVGTSEPDEGEAPIAYLVFDLLYLDGKDLTDLPIEERRAMLEELLIPNDMIQLSPVTDGAGEALLAAVGEQGLGGIVAKRLGSRYRSGVSADWLEIERGAPRG